MPFAIATDADDTPGWQHAAHDVRFELSAVNPPEPPTFTEGYGSVHFSTKNQVEKSILCFSQESRWADWTLTLRQS